MNSEKGAEILSHRDVQVLAWKSPAVGVDQPGEDAYQTFPPVFDLLPVPNWAAVSGAREEAAGLEAGHV